MLQWFTLPNNINQISSRVAAGDPARMWHYFRMIGTTMFAKAAINGLTRLAEMVSCHPVCPPTGCAQVCQGGWIQQVIPSLNTVLADDKEEEVAGTVQWNLSHLAAIGTSSAGLLSYMLNPN
jgi:hypothetical protein